VVAAELEDVKQSRSGAEHAGRANKETSSERRGAKAPSIREVPGNLTRVMQPETHPDALLQAQEENRHLRTTIAEMRAALELLQSEKEQAGQRAAHQAAREAAHLHDTISAMREQLENLEREKRGALQQAAADGHSDLQQHIATIRTQREEMERMNEAHATELQRLRRAVRDEQRLLAQTIAALREHLEAHHGPS